MGDTLLGEGDGEARVVRDERLQSQIASGVGAGRGRNDLRRNITFSGNLFGPEGVVGGVEGEYYAVHSYLPRTLGLQVSGCGVEGVAIPFSRARAGPARRMEGCQHTAPAPK
jgi:hypothetical protein